jgi:protein TonB
MGKIVKYCAACDESFAVKFGFCPNCGQGLTAFELNQVANETPVSETTQKEVVFEDSIAQTPPPVFTKAAPPVIETAAVAAVQPEASSEEAKAETIAEVQPEDTPLETKTFTAAAGASGNYQTVADNYHKTSAPEISRRDDGYHVTVVEEKNGKQRNLLLLGSMALVLTMAFGSTVYSLFNKDLLIGSIGEDSSVYIPIVDEVPMEVEEEEPKKDDDDGGGGGGGGRDKPTPTSKGQLATQTEKPMIAPTVTLVKKDFELKYQASTQGTKQIKQTDEPYGDPNSKYTLSSDGMGTGGGQGSGIGTGQGSGRGTGQGSGIGSGSGSGNGNGNGSGTGDGSGSLPKPPPPPKPVPVGVTEGVKILSRPQPKYTDAARQNQVQGTVTVKVTFNANGSIGSIAPVSGLPYGLTEQAIAAARSIKFEPAKRNGVPYSVAKTVAYTFTIY